MNCESAPSGHQKNKKKESTFKVERAYLCRVSDCDGRSCSGEDYRNLGGPLMSLIPGLAGSYSAPQIVEFAKKLEACGCDFTKLAADQTDVK
jgi:hypothetical protein